MLLRTQFVLRQFPNESESARARIEFAQLNRPRWDRAIHGVCTVQRVHGTPIIQRLHQFLLDDERGIPKARVVVRVDGYWEAKR